MDVFSLVDTDMLRKVISQLKSSTCLLYPIPTTFFKTLFNCISEEVKEIVNHFTGAFPTAVITAMVKPLLKKSHQDSSALCNFQPISNLPLCKILKKLVFNQHFVFKSNVVFGPTTAQGQP
jgi:hypothetical protein